MILKWREGSLESSVDNIEATQVRLYPLEIVSVL